MKERPIIFSGSMVRAMLDGRKTQTRRVVKAQPDAPVTDAIPRRDYPHGPPTVEWYWRPKFGHRQSAPSAGWDFKCPYGQPGDQLWVREAHFINDYRGAQVPEGERTDCEVVYRADPLPCWEGEEQYIPWRPSIHMPRWASRITLEITSVRVERLQDISEEDAIAEGPPGLQFPAPPGSFWVTEDGRRRAFRRLWEEINGPDSWDANPWVWVVEFKRLEAGGTG